MNSPFSYLTPISLKRNKLTGPWRCKILYFLLSWSFAFFTCRKHTLKLWRFLRMASPPSSPSPPPSPTPSITPSLLQSTFSHLPVMSMRKKIIDKIQQNRVTLIIGETGCGITSQTVPFFSSFYFFRTALTVSNNFTLRCWNF